MKSYRLFILFCILLGFTSSLRAQPDKKMLSSTSLLSSKTDSIKHADTLAAKAAIKKDSIPKHNPRIATRRSALIPGWGQAYNREYWKIPIVYGILAIPTGFFFYNNSYYKKTKFAFEARFKEANGDPSDVAAIDPQLVNLSAASLQSYRNAFRQDRDYSVLWFLVAWGLQVADATVFAHLKQFDVSSDLSMEIKPVFDLQTKSTGLGLALSLGSSHKQPIAR